MSIILPLRTRKTEAQLQSDSAGIRAITRMYSEVLRDIMSY
jgi:hypothetical protein